MTLDMRAKEEGLGKGAKGRRGTKKIEWRMLELENGSEPESHDCGLTSESSRLRSAPNHSAIKTQPGRARSAPKSDQRDQLFKVCDVDLTRFGCIDVTTALPLSLKTARTYRGSRRPAIAQVGRCGMSLGNPRIVATR